MNYLKDYLKELSKKDLKRCIRSNKEYFYFDVLVFNSGMVVNVKCTNIYKSITESSFNGFDMFIENNYDNQDLFTNELNKRLV